MRSMRTLHQASRALKAIPIQPLVPDLAAHDCSEEAFRIFEFDPATKVTVQRLRDMVHPEDLPTFDTGYNNSTSIGPKWSTRMRPTSGYVARHPDGL